MIQFVSSFNFPFQPQTGWTYFSNFGITPTIGGRFGGRAISFRNTGFGEQNISQRIDSHNRTTFGFALRQVDDRGNWAPAVEIIRMGAGGSRLFTLRTRADGALDVLTTNSLILQGTTPILQFGRWYYLELVYNVAGSIEFWMDDALVVNGAALDPQFPDRVYIRWAFLGSMGIDVDDFYLGDDSGLSNTTRIGPVKIGSWYCQNDDLVNWDRHGSATNAGAINERWGTNPSPDGDATYVSAVGSGIVDLYDLHPENSCTNKILMLAISAYGKSPVGAGGGILGVVARLDPTNTLNTGIGGLITLNASYEYFQRLVLKSPLSGVEWTDGEVENSLWGLSSAGGQCRVSAFWVEKVQTLRNVPVDCGQTGSYVLTK